MKTKLVKESLDEYSANDNIAKTILEIIQALFGDMSLRTGRELMKNIPMSGRDWDELKFSLKKIDPEFKWPKKYTAMEQASGFKAREISLRKLLMDAFGGEWYFDDDDLVQGDKTIVNYRDGITVEEVITQIFNKIK